MITYELLDDAQKPSVAGMTFPAYRSLLQRNPRRVFAVRASMLGRPLGLALVRLPRLEQNAELLSLWVDPVSRNEGVATGMLRRMEEALAEHGYENLQAMYMLGKPSIPIVERVLEKSGWDAPRTRGYAIRFTRDQARQVPWFKKYELGTGYEIFPWRDLTSEEGLALQASQRETAWIPEDLEPWKYDATAEPITSLGLKLNGEIVGWVINQEISEEMIRITCAFVRRDLQRLGKILPLFSESLDLLQQTSYVHVSGVSMSNYRPIIAFYKRWCGPWADHLGEARESSKRLQSVGEEKIEEEIAA